MKEYTIYCTPSQTKKALELGAPIISIPFGAYFCTPDNYFIYNDFAIEEPTTEQMINWLEKKGFYFRLDTSGCSVEIDFNCIIEKVNVPRKEATLAAIDVALEYLTNNL